MNCWHRFNLQAPYSHPHKHSSLPRHYRLVVVSPFPVTILSVFFFNGVPLHLSKLKSIRHYSPETHLLLSLVSMSSFGPSVSLYLDLVRWVDGLLHRWPSVCLYFSTHCKLAFKSFANVRCRVVFSLSVQVTIFASNLQSSANMRGCTGNWRPPIRRPGSANC